MHYYYNLSSTSGGFVPECLLWLRSWTLLGTNFLTPGKKSCGRPWRQGRLGSWHFLIDIFVD